MRRGSEYSTSSIGSYPMPPRDQQHGGAAADSELLQRLFERLTESAHGAARLEQMLAGLADTVREALAKLERPETEIYRGAEGRTAMIHRLSSLEDGQVEHISNAALRWQFIATIVAGLFSLAAAAIAILK